MFNAVRVKVFGDYACFTDTTSGVNKQSYPMLTVTAARGMMEAIFWKPEIRWNILRISVLNKVEYMTMGFNELRQTPDKGGLGIALYTQPRKRILRDVAYVIEATFEVNSAGLDKEKNEGINANMKYFKQITRRIKERTPYRRLVGGMSEFEMNFEGYDSEDMAVPGSKVYESMGVMLTDLDYTNPHKPEAKYEEVVLRSGVYVTEKGREVYGG